MSQSLEYMTNLKVGKFVIEQVKAFMYLGVNFNRSKTGTMKYDRVNAVNRFVMNTMLSFRLL